MIREAKVVRETKETKINLVLKIDGKGESDIQTRIPFFDHMLTLFAKHSFIDLQLVCQGDIEVDAHHTVEDCGLSLGKAFFQALGSKAGISRYGTGFNSKISNQFDSESLRGEFYMPMDECLIRCVIDFGGRPYLVYRGLDELALAICRPKDDELRQDMSTMFRFGLAKEFFQAFVNEARCNLHIELLYGEEPHHIVEGMFKAFARAVDQACRKDPRLGNSLPTTKGKL